VKLKLFSAACAALAISVSAPALAQAQFGPLLGVEIPFDVNRGNNIGVLERDRPELTPLGIPAGGFLIFPSIDGGTGYTSNVYGSAAAKTSDAFFTLDPELLAQSRWSRNSLNFKMDGSFKRFASQSLKDENGAYVGADGRIDIVGDSNIYALLSYEQAYDAQFSGDFPANAAQSVAYRRLNSILRATYEFTRVRLTASADVNQLNYSNTRSILGEELDQTYRDRTVYRASLRAEYALTRNVAAFLQGTYEKDDYVPSTILGVGQDRSGDGMRFIGGLTFDLSSLVRAAVGVGYFQRNYDRANFSNIGSVAADVRLSYFLSDLTTVTFGLRRGVEDAIVFGSPGYTLLSETLHVDHELLRNLLLFGEVDHETDNFSAVTRRDRLYQVSAGATYLANRRWQFIPTLNYLDRQSRGQPVGQRFSEFRAVLRIKTQI
jgi:hypothetical protein